MAILRRQFLGSSFSLLAGANLPAWLATPLQAQAATPLRRFSADSSDPRATAAMQAYRRGVGVMRQRPRHDPTGWYWQANMHGFPGGNAELDATFPATGIPGVAEDERRRLRALAKQTWGQCPHGDPLFLPWHRMYLFFFERIVQEAAGTSDWALPYWSWTAQRLLPRSFREPVNGNQAGNALFNPTRENGFNGNVGGENAQGLSDEEVDVSMLRRPELDTRLDGRPGRPVGFGPLLEGGPHGQVHVAVGGDMSEVARAARDPVFWLHHCNVDRLWDSWRRVPGHANPTGANAQNGWRADTLSSIAAG